MRRPRTSDRRLHAVVLDGVADLRPAALSTLLLTAAMLCFWIDGERHPWRDLAASGLAVLGLGLVVVAALRPPARPARRRRSDVVLTACLGVFALGGLVLAIDAIDRGPEAYSVDAAVYNHVNARLVLDGRNPYTSDDAWYPATRLSPDVTPTVLRQGRYAERERLPDADELTALTEHKLRTGEPAGPEFDERTLHSYPALAFLVHVPGLWLGLDSTVVTSLVLFVLLALAIVWAVPARLRPATLLILLGNGLAVGNSVLGVFDAWALLPALLAFQLRRPIASPLLLGAACAIKQIVWPIALLAAVSTWRSGGPRAALRHVALMAAAFALPNLPFALDAPRAWLESLLVPMSLPMFPDGFGLISLSTSGLLPFAPKPVYALAELAAMAALCWWFARRRRPARPELALLVGMLPFLLAWRCGPSYLWLVPTLALWVLPRGEAAVHRLRPAAARPAAAAA